GERGNRHGASATRELPREARGTGGATDAGVRRSGVTAAFEREEDNFRQALRWSLDRGDAEALDIGLRLAGALGWFWFLHGYPSEARDWFDALLKPVAGPPSAVRAKALNAAGFRAIDHAD